MSGRLVVAYPHGTENSPLLNSSQTCYFIVMKHPLMCSTFAESQIAHDSTVHGRENENTNGTNNTNEVMEMDKNKGVMIITVDTVSGQLIHAGIPQKDIFSSMDEAIRGIPALCPHTTHSFEVRTLFEFLAFAGGCLSEEFIHLLFIEASTLLQDGRRRGGGGSGGGDTLYSYSTGEKNSHMEDSTKNWYIPPIYAVKKAKWCRIPLRITVPALQHSFKISEIMHSLTHNSRYTTPLYSLPNLTNGSEPPYLYYSPGIDITHSSIFKDAVIRYASINQSESNENQNNILKSMKDKDSSNSTNINVFLPPLPKKTGRDALGRCDCLWNEELISFCEVFALGNCCCRLALGSCSSIPLLNPFHDSSIALLLVRISRLAICGCFYDYTVESTKIQFEDYVSTLETEFQLFILRKSQHDISIDNKKRVKSISSLIWRRGTDFVNNKEIIEQQKKFDDYSKRFINPLPSQEDHVSSIFFGYLDRYGPNTRIILAHAGSAAWNSKTIVSDIHYSSTTSNNNNNNVRVYKSPQRHTRVGSPMRKQLIGSSSVLLSSSSQPSSMPSSPKKQSHSLSHFFISSSDQRGEMDSVSLDMETIENKLQLSLESLAAHVKSHGLKPGVTIGDLCYFPSQDNKNKESGINNEEVFLNTFWGDETMKKSQEDEVVVDNWIPRVCVEDDTEVSIIASIIVSIGWIVGWLCNQMDEHIEELQLLREHKLLVENMISLLFNSAAGTSRTITISRKGEAITSVWSCLMDICIAKLKGVIPTRRAFSLFVWIEAQRIVRLTEVREKTSSYSYSGHTNNTVVHNTPSHSLHSVLSERISSFLVRLFLPEGKFYPREHVRDRIILLTHPSKLSFIMGAHLMFPHSETQCTSSSTTMADTNTNNIHETGNSSNQHRRRLFPFTPMRSVNPPIYSHDHPSLIVSTSTSSGQTTNTMTAASQLTLGMFRGLTHPFSQSLLIPSCFDRVEYTVALPSLSHITHIALTIANAIQEASYAAALSISLSTCCYVGQTRTRVVLEDLPLPLCVSTRSAQSGNAAPRLIFYALHVSTADVDLTSEGEEVVNSDLIQCEEPFHSTAPVIARFLQFSFHGSGCNAMALPPVLVFGKPIEFMPNDEIELLSNKRTGLGRMLATPIPPFVWASQQEKEENEQVENEENEENNLSTVKDTGSLFTEYRSNSNGHKTNTFDNNNQNELENSILQQERCHVPVVATTQGRCEMYVHKLSSTIPAELFQLTLGLTLQLETKRLQCHVRRYYRDWCLYRIGLPRWVMNPMCQIFPHSAVHRSRLPEDTEDFIRIREQQEENFHRQMDNHSKVDLKKMKVKREERRHCALCKRKFSWFFAARECNRCQRHVCKKCFYDTFIALPELGLHETNYRVCLKCLQKCKALEGIIEGFYWSECNDEVDNEIETKEAIEFFTRQTIPKLSCALFACKEKWWSDIQQSSLLSDSHTPYQLTMYPHTRVVSAPCMDDTSMPLFEEVLGVAGIVNHSNSGSLVDWRCVMDEECTDSSTRVSRHVVLLLPQDATISYGVVHYTLTGKLRGDVELQLLIGNSLHELHLFHSTSIHPSDDNVHEFNSIDNQVKVLQLHHQEKEQQLQGTRLFFNDEEEKENEKEKGPSTPRVHTTVVIAALFFHGAISDLALLRVKHFSLWGRFVLTTPEIHSAYHKCKPDLSHYGNLTGITVYSTRGVMSVACLPRLLPMTRLIPLRNVITHTNTEHLLLEFDFGVPSTVCGFVLELHHPVMMTSSQFGIASTLRLVGVSACGFRGNIGHFVLPWPPLPVLENSPHELCAYAYSLPSTNYDLLSVLVEVVEWRCTSPATAVLGREGKKKKKMDNNDDNNNNNTKNMCTETFNGNARVSTMENTNTTTTTNTMNTIITESSLRRGVYLGKIHFWTSTNATTRRMVSGHTYTSIHAAVSDSGTHH